MISCSKITWTCSSMLVPRVVSSWNCQFVAQTVRWLWYVSKFRCGVHDFILLHQFRGDLIKSFVIVWNLVCVHWSKRRWVGIRWPSVRDRRSETIVFSITRSLFRTWIEYLTLLSWMKQAYNFCWVANRYLILCLSLNVCVSSYVLIRGFQCIREIYHGSDMGPEWKQTLCFYADSMSGPVAFKRKAVSDVAPVSSIRFKVC